MIVVLAKLAKRLCVTSRLDDEIALLFKFYTVYSNSGIDSLLKYLSNHFNNIPVCLWDKLIDLDDCYE